MQQSQHLVLLPGPGELVLEAGAEMLAARQAGERVLLAGRPGRRLGGAQLGDVHGDGQHLGGPARAASKRCLGGQQPARAVEIGQRVVVGRGHGHAGLEHLLVEHTALQRILLAVALQERQPQGGGAVDAEQTLVGSVDHDQPTAGIDHRDGGRHRVEHPLEHLLLGVVVAGVQLALQVGRALGQQQLLAAQGQEVTGPGAELEMVDRAEQEIGGAGLQRPVAELAVLIDGDHDHRHVDQRRPAAQGAHEAGAVHVGHVEIGDDQIRHHAAVERGQRLHRARERADRQTFLDRRGEACQDVAVGDAIIDDGDSRHPASR